MSCRHVGKLALFDLPLMALTLPPPPFTTPFQLRFLYAAFNKSVGAASWGSCYLIQ